MYLSFEPKENSLPQSADSQSTKYSVSEHMVDPVYVLAREARSTNQFFSATSMKDDVISP